MILRTKIKVSRKTKLSDEDLAEIETERIIRGEEFADTLRENKLKENLPDFVDAIYDTDRAILMYEADNGSGTITVEDASMGKFTISGTIPEIYEKLEEKNKFIDLSGTVIDLKKVAENEE